MKRATEVFFPGEGNAVYPNDVYADDHPYIAMYPSKFVDVEVIEAPSKKRSAPEVEQATAAPGEKRAR